MCRILTRSDLDQALVSAGLALAVRHCERKAVLALHQIAEKQHRLVVRVVQYILWEGAGRNF